MSTGEGEAMSVARRLKAEMRAYLFISLYLFICFSVVLLYQGAMQSSVGENALPLSFAAVKALLIGKFILVGKAIGLGTRVKHSVLVHRIAWKSFAFLLLLVLFGWLEEFVVGFYHGLSFGEIVGEIAAVPLIQKLAATLLMLMVLIPMITFEEVDRALGGGELTRMLFSASED